MNVFAGRYHLKLERYSDYTTGGKYPSMKVRTLIKLWGYNLTLRIRATGYTKEAIELAQKAFPRSIILCSEYGGFNRVWLMDEKSDMIMPLEFFRHWYKHDIHHVQKGVFYAKKLDKYVGYSHRAIGAFGIGDKLFDEIWYPDWSDLKIEWVQDYCKGIGYSKIPSSIEEAKTFVKLHYVDLEGYAPYENIVDYIPFCQRGGKIIKTKEDAIQAALNFSHYMS